jgi:predicted ester cyclase
VSLRIIALSLSIGLVGATACGGDAREPSTPKSSEPAAMATTTSARADSNKAVVTRYLDEVWAKRNLDAIPKYVAADLVNHGAIPEAQGAAGLRTIASKLLVAFPDMTGQVTNVATDGDEIVIVRQTMEATHTGNLDFKQPLPATGKHVKVDQVHTYRIKDGKIVETWMVMDRFDLLSQLGVLPKPSGH